MAGNQLMNPDLYELFREHIGHKVEVVCYGEEGDDPVDVSIECEDCGVVLIDAEKP